MSKSTTGPRPRPGTTKTSKSTKKSTSTDQAASADGRSHPAQVRSFRRRHPVLFALMPVGLVVAAVATMVVIKAAGGPAEPATAATHLPAGGSNANATANAVADPGTVPLSPSVVAALSVPASTLEAVGAPGSVTLPSKVTGGSVAKDAAGKVEITYVGAEYCPYCAAERWAIAVALSRFGTFSNLSGTHSSSSDVYPDTQTLSFYGSTYNSPYVDFQPVEEATNQQVGGTYQALQTPTSAQNALVTTYDPEGSIPFLDIANRYVVTGASFSPQVLQGLSRQQIADQLDDPSSPIAQAVDGTANAITAAISAVTGNQPSAVGNSATIQGIEKQLGA